MAGSIRTRVTQMVSALKNTPPEAGMSQAIREVDSVLEGVGAELCRVASEKHLALSSLAELVRERNTAIPEGGAPLAAAAIQRKISLLKQTIARIAKEEEEMEGYLHILRKKKQEMEEVLRQFTRTQATQRPR